MEGQQEKKNPLDEAYKKMCDVRTYLGKAGYAIGNAKAACGGIGGIDSFVSDLAEIGAKLAFMLGDCIGFCDNQAARIERERVEKMKAIEKAKEEERLASEQIHGGGQPAKEPIHGGGQLAKEPMQKLLPPIMPGQVKPKMAVVEDDAKTPKRRGRKNAK